MKKVILFLSISLMAGLLFTNVYNSVVDAPNWCNHIPESINNLRGYYEVSNPGNFYRIFSPLNQVLTVLVLILFWRRGKKIRLYFALALVLAIVADIMTFGYFYPRNEIFFSADLINDLTEINNACAEWQSMNWVRSLIILLGLAFQFTGLNKLNEST